MRQLGLYSEHQIQTQIINYLRVKGYYVMRLNAGKYRVGEGRASRFIMGQEAGTPDLMAYAPWMPPHLVVPGQVHLLFVEVKVPGKKPTPIQVAKMAELETYGGRCIVAHSIEEVQAAL